MLAEIFLAIMLAITCLYWWVRDREREVQRRQDNCLHPPERQIEIRVSNILHPTAGHWVIPGRRWIKKHCELCGWQRSLYAPSYKPWNDYVAEYEQETIDRQAEFQARKREYEQLEQYKKEQRRERAKSSKSRNAS